MSRLIPRSINMQIIYYIHIVWRRFLNLPCYTDTLESGGWRKNSDLMQSERLMEANKTRIEYHPIINFSVCIVSFSITLLHPSQRAQYFFPQLSRIKRALKRWLRKQTIIMNNYRGCILQQNLRYIKLKSCWLFFKGDCNHWFLSHFFCMHKTWVSPSTTHQKKIQNLPYIEKLMCILADRCLDLLQGKL